MIDAAGWLPASAAMPPTRQLSDDELAALILAGRGHGVSVDHREFDPLDLVTPTTINV